MPYPSKLGHGHLDLAELDSRVPVHQHVVQCVFQRPDVTLNIWEVEEGGRVVSLVLTLWLISSGYCSILTNFISFGESVEQWFTYSLPSLITSGIDNERLNCSHQRSIPVQFLVHYNQLSWTMEYLAPKRCILALHIWALIDLCCLYEEFLYLKKQ